MALTPIRAGVLVWQDLGLEAPTMIEADIKRAYALRLREVRPDTDPDGFERLQAARDYALAQLRYREVAARVGFTDFSGEPNPAFTDAAYPLGDRLALLIANGTERGRHMNWNAVLDELAKLPLADRMTTGADLGDQLLRAHGWYERGAAYSYPKSQPLLFDVKLMEFIMKGVDWTALEQRDLVDPEALRWLFIRTGLSRGTWEAPMESRERSPILQALKTSAKLAAIAGVLALLSAAVAGNLDINGVFEDAGRVLGMDSGGPPDANPPPPPDSPDVGIHVPDKPPWIDISHFGPDRP